jgi:hypothetical protein
MILVKAEDSSAESPTLENVVAYASALASDGSAQPAAIGERIGALQLKRGKEPNTVDRILERLIFTTVLCGRTYVLELRARQDQVGGTQDMLFAVIAGLREIGTTPTETAPEAEGTQQGSAGKTEEEKSTTDGSRKELDEIFE